jgi:hypothetical protein
MRGSDPPRRGVESSKRAEYALSTGVRGLAPLDPVWWSRIHTEPSTRGPTKRRAPSATPRVSQARRDASEAHGHW